jgi:hypothetical protein
MSSFDAKPECLICYAIPCERAPHGELYVMSLPKDWPERRALTISRHPELFPYERRPIPEVPKRPVVGKQVI